ncbi:hypothetical protein O0L34_g12026 [Tuta absoluta]|nr:hypothetical protein O0L34_g12026 [Tuta absoluta]
MPRNYIKKTPGRTLISEEQILTAKKLIEEGKSQRYAADFVGILESTLRNRLKMKHVPTGLGRFKPTFTRDQEAEFAVHCQEMDERYFGVTINDLRRLAYEFAEVNKIDHRFDTSARMAGRDWVEGFLKRNNHLGLRQSAPISLARAIGFNKTQVERFFKNLKEVYDKYKLRPHRVYNMDETGMSTVPKKTPKVVSRKGKKVVGKIVSAERGMTITAVMCMSATGHFVPPALIFPRKKEKAELLDGAPPASILMVSESGFINTTLFLNWLHHFKDFVHPTPEDPVLLILDNHSSHISLEALTYAKKHNIIMLTIPPHGSHKIQPLDVAVHSPLKTKYSIECEKWMNRHPGRGITQFQVAGLFSNAYKHVATISNAESGFRATGIFPYADDLFDETDFAPSSVTDLVPSNENSREIDTEPTQFQDMVNVSSTETEQESTRPDISEVNDSTSKETNAPNQNENLSQILLPPVESSQDYRTPSPPTQSFDRLSPLNHDEKISQMLAPPVQSSRDYRTPTPTMKPSGRFSQPDHIDAMLAPSPEESRRNLKTPTTSIDFSGRLSPPDRQDDTSGRSLSRQNVIDNDVMKKLSNKAVTEYPELTVRSERPNESDSDDRTICESPSVLDDLEPEPSGQKGNIDFDNVKLPFKPQIVTVSQLSPLPRITERKKRTKASLKSEIITSTPYKKQLEEKKKIEEEKKNRSHLKKLVLDKPPKRQNKKLPVKRKDTEPQPGPSHCHVDGKSRPKRGATKPQASKPNKKPRIQPKHGVTKTHNKLRNMQKRLKSEHFCPMCNEKYADPPSEDWIECSSCNKWFHEDCTGYEGGLFTCDLCK